MKQTRLRQISLAVASATLGVGAALAAGACGEDRGSVEVEGGTTGGAGTVGTTGTAPTPTGTTGTTTTPTTESTGTTTSP